MTKKSRKATASSKRKTAKSRKELLTIGYEQATPAAFLEELKRARADLVVDTRAVAASRRPGFSKRQLAATLDEADIGYVHLRKLGTPAEGRQAARAGDLDTLWRIYDRHIKTPEAQEELDALTAMAKTGRRLCLLCYERDAAQCHRTRIADILAERTGMRVNHLVVRP